jgi:hypothetical protein
MRSRLSGHRRRLTASIVLLGTAGVLVCTAGVLAGTVGLPLGASTACGCEGGSPVTIREGSSSGAAVPAGTKLVAKSSNFVIHMTAGNVECGASTIEGPLESNGKVEDEINAKSVTLSECDTTFSGDPTASVSTNAPWTIGVQWWYFTSAWFRPFWRNHLTSLTYSVTLSSGPKCVYGFSEMMSESAGAGPPLVAKFTKQKVTEESGEAPCESKAEVSGEYIFKTAGGTELAATSP